MAGIISYGAYVPYLRLGRAAIAKGLPGEKAVANFDEDSITMAVAAALDCLGGMERQTIDGLFFASTTSPYREKQSSTIVAAATDLRRDILALDLANSLRVATAGMAMALNTVKAGAAKQVLITAADSRLGQPGSDFEMNLGDGAAAIVIGDSNVIAEVEESYSVSDEIMDVWRDDSDVFVRSWEDRFVGVAGYIGVVREAVSQVLKKANLTPSDFAKVVLYAPDGKKQAELVKGLGFDPKTQASDPILASVGSAGSAHLMMGLVAALETANPGDRILLANYGDGADVFILRVTEEIKKLKGMQGISGNLARKKMIPNYDTYLQLKGLLVKDTGRPAGAGVAASGMWRERDKNLRLYGVRCRQCGTAQYPPQRVCYKCRTKDQFDTVRLSDKKAKVFTYSLDYRSADLDAPAVIPVIDFDGGGRLLCVMTDREIDQVKIGMQVEMTFRKLFSANGLHNYFWKCTPVREGK
ncbi:MAG: OB-fold domain-containing protein [Chloroflexota bacterium]|nr:OB-fold domain-containing protein [Chloroflexota bacterium]